MSESESRLGPINLVTLGAMSETDARKLLEAARWPNGPVCPHCGVVGDAGRIESAADTANKVRDGLYHCRSCDEPFTVTVGTVMESSHVPLTKWLLAWYLFASSKKSMSALQLQRQLGLGSYRTAWFMAHRIRHAMQNGGPQGPLTGVVEVDETYIGGKPRTTGKHPPKGLGKLRGKNPNKGRGTKKSAVQVLVQRGGAARARVVPDVTAKTLQPFIREHTALSAAIHSDEWQGYKGVGEGFAGGHHTVAHSYGEYARDGVHSNSAESFNGLFKRAFHGAWHHVSREHLPRYLDEACFRWTHREEKDGERTVRAVGQSGGVRLYLKKPRRQGEAGDARLVADG